MNKISFVDFCDQIEIKNQIVVNRNTDGCDYFFRGIELMHERTKHSGRVRPKTPAQRLHQVLFKPFSSFWTIPVYNNLILAQEDAEKYGGEATECFYCDENNKVYFLSFSDMDKALRFCYDKFFELIDKNN